MAWLSPRSMPKGGYSLRPGWEFRTWGLGYRVLCFVFWVWGLGLRAEGFGFRALGLGFWI